jgi:hypothetical protein
MADIAKLREGIYKNISTIPGLRSNPYSVPNVNPPYAIISLDSIDYSKAFNNGLTQYTFTVTLIVGLQSERTSQATLDSYCSPTSSNSIKSAIESDRTLNGSAYDLFVSGMRNYGSTTIGENTYLAAEFDLVVQAN